MPVEVRQQLRREVPMFVSVLVALALAVWA